MGRISKEESDAQKIVVAFLVELAKQTPGLLWTSTNMGSYMSVGQVIQAKAMGYTIGTPDLFILTKGSFGPALFIEMKKKGGRQRDTQKVWQSLALANGYGYKLCFSAAEAVRDIRIHLGV